MGLFSRKPDPRPQGGLLSATPSDLSRIGRTAYGGASTHPLGRSALEPGELDGFTLTTMQRGGLPTSASLGWRPYLERVLTELEAAADEGGEWAPVGAWLLAWELVPQADHDHPRYQRIADRALTELRDDGVSYAAVPPHGLARWTAVHGHDGASPAGWPRSREDREIPGEDQLPAPAPLKVGEPRALVERTINDAPNRVLADLRDDGLIYALIDGVDAEDGVRKRWDWHGLERPTYREFLLELGERLVLPQPWSHDDIVPYFPCRARSRDELRIEARAAASASTSGGPRP